MHTIQSSDPARYGVAPAPRELHTDDDIIRAALDILSARVRTRPVMESPSAVRDYLRLRVTGLEYEVFGVLFLDAQHRIIADEHMFRGTLTQTSVYPREVVKAALAHNAAALVLYHNHPSGASDPSKADEMLTDNLKRALQLVDVRVLDHIVIGATCVSFAERGLL